MVKHRNFRKDRSFPRKFKLLSKRKFLDKTGICGRKLKFWTITKILVEHRHFSQIIKFVDMIEIFSRCSKFWSKINFLHMIEILVEYRKCWSNREILVDICYRNSNFAQTNVILTKEILSKKKLKFSTKIKIFGKIPPKNILK